MQLTHSSSVGLPVCWFVDVQLPVVAGGGFILVNCWEGPRQCNVVPSVVWILQDRNIPLNICP